MPIIKELKWLKGKTSTERVFAVIIDSMVNVNHFIMVVNHPPIVEES